MAKRIVVPYTPRKWQAEAFEQAKRFSVLVVHRRAGKTIYALNKLLRDVLSAKNPNPRGAYIAPFREQAKNIAWKELKKFIAPLPHVKINEAELRIELPNGGTIQLMGAENENAIRGIGLVSVVMDEVGEMSSSVWEEVVRPTLSDHKGNALFIGTPKGRNTFYRLYERGLDPSNEEWSSMRLTWKDTGALDTAEIESAKRDIAEEKFAQEYECCFDAAIKGAFFGKAIAQAQQDGRVSFVPYDSSIPVCSAWDIGLDGTVIWYAQRNGDGVSIIDCDIFTDEDVPECARSVLSKPYVYYEHIVPHDTAKRSVLNKGESTIKLIKSLMRGVKVRKLKKPGNGELINEIHMTRKFIHKCIFDRNKCGKGIDGLQLYRAKLDSMTGLPTNTPIHDENSHIGDAFRTLAVGYKGESSRTHNSRYSVQGSYNPYGSSHDVVNSQWNPYGGIK